MEKISKINDNEYLATDPVTGGTGRVVSPRLSREGAVLVIAKQLEETGARPAKGATTTIHFQIRMAEDRQEPDRPC